MYVPKLLVAFGVVLRQTKILENKDNRSKIMGRDQSEHFNPENSRESVWFSEKFEKSRTSAEKKSFEIFRQPSIRTDILPKC